MKKTKMSKKNRHNGQQEYDVEERSDRLELDGVIDECLPGTYFKVKCTAGNEVLCTLSGKLRMNRIRLLPGDRVKCEVSPYDVSRGRISWRY